MFFFFLKSLGLSRFAPGRGPRYGSVALHIRDAAVLKGVRDAPGRLPLNDNNGRRFGVEKYAAIREHLTERSAD